MNDGILYRVSLKVVPAAIWLVSKLWFATCRVREHGRERRQSVTGGNKQVIATFWHYSLLVVFQLAREFSGVAMVSSSRDGEYIARFARLCGFSAVRGSRNKQGVQALKELLKSCKEGRNTALVADGSQGPARVAQPGSILLASRAGIPILPVAWSASRYITIRSWDRTAFPKPFATVDFVYGEPIEVPPGLKSEGIEEYRLLLENRLNALYEEMWAIHGKKEH